jgi:hypothetical protein
MGERLAVRNLFTDLREQGQMAAARRPMASGTSRRLPTRLTASHPVDAEPPGKAEGSVVLVGQLQHPVHQLVDA